MTRQKEDWKRYRELRERFLDDYPRAAVPLELESLILEDVQKKRDFVSHLHLRAAIAVCDNLKPNPLAQSVQNPMLSDPVEPQFPACLSRSTRSFGARKLMWSLSLTAVALWFASIFLKVKSVDVRIDVPIAVLRFAEGCQWGESSLPTVVGSDLFAGRMQLISGTALLEMRNTQLTLQGPVDFELIGQNRCKLHSGHVLMVSTNGGDGLVINVPNGAIADFGAEIGIQVSKAGDAELHVFSGSVKAKHCTLGKSLEASESDDIRIQPNAIRKLNKKSLLIDRGQPVAGSLLPSACQISRVCDWAVSFRS
ncbi:MAG TPA: hypothetical protein DDZ51_02070 [Planctomycetaceae bacterium]|nr:hypothetical protein [Planctomycetaceae bacterium]